MSYRSLEECLIDLEKHGQLVRIKEEVDPHLEMAAIQLKVYEAQGPALLFERVRGTRYRAAANIFGTLERSRFLFRDTMASVQRLIRLKNEPVKAIKHPFANITAGLAALKALPLRRSGPATPFEKISISDLPLIRHWPKDGGAFITLPQVYSEDVQHPGVMHSNLGMYRIQLTGNDYVTDREIGLHYQIHRGIGVHQHKAMQQGEPLKVSIFVGGPPAHTVSAVMPLPEGIPELSFAGVLGGRRFRYYYEDGYAISSDADFVITGEIHGDTKPEGPFGDHLGYYSLTHPFPVLRVKQVYARRNAIWPFTVVGRPPQEDTSFGALIHELTGEAIPKEIPGVKEVHAVDAAGVHPLLLAVGSERYTPFESGKRPAELLTIANHILGTGQLSLAKYLLIAADEEGRLDTHDISSFFRFVLERIDTRRDLHFQTQTTIDTLDYSGSGLNAGSKLVIAAYGRPVRQLADDIPSCLKEQHLFTEPRLVMPGVIALTAPPFRSYGRAGGEMEDFDKMLAPHLSELAGVPLLIICDDSGFVAGSLNNFLWVTFTRSNPSHDTYGIGSFCQFKHWGTEGPLIIDARIKPHHAPPLEMDPEAVRKAARILDKGGSLYGKL